MLCSELSLVKHDRIRPEAVTLNCRRWTCEHCRPKRQAQVRRLCRAGEPALMVTLTSQAAPGGDTAAMDAAACALVRAWQLITKRYKRLHGEEHFPYFAVVEETKKGWPHLHILCRATFIDHKWLSEQLREITGSYVVWLTRLSNANKGAWYVSKYLGKAPTSFKGCKRYWRSQDWIVDAELWDEEHQKHKGQWVRSESSLPRIVDLYKRRGFHVVEWTAEHVLFGPGTDLRYDDEGGWYWCTTDDDRRRMGEHGPN